MVAGAKLIGGGLAAIGVGFGAVRSRYNIFSFNQWSFKKSFIKRRII
jgi:hypothetical protein